MKLSSFELLGCRWCSKYS